MEGKQLASFVINRRIAAKRRAPHWTAAVNLQKRTRAALVKKYGPGNVHAVDASGKECDVLDLLQRGQPVTFQHFHVSKLGDGTFFKPEEFALTGERTVQLDLT